MNSLLIRAARPSDLPAISPLMEPFVARGELLPRSPEELSNLLPQAFVAEMDGRVAGFAALEIYSKKLAEIHCLSFETTAAGVEIARWVVQACVQRAREQTVLEVLAIVSPLLEQVLKTCGFDYSLPNQKRALFLRANHVDRKHDQQSAAGPARDVNFRDALNGDLGAVQEFLAPFVARGELLPRGPDELIELLRHAFIAEAEGQIVGFAALEIYSPKLAEIQCLSVRQGYQGHGIGRQLVELCVGRARQHQVAETMGISSQDEFFISCGFDYCLSGPKMALFLRTRD
jgi:N-acetylglutamate synthase-like GNAT family acetyltransferase